MSDTAQCAAPLPRNPDTRMGAFDRATSHASVGGDTSTPSATSTASKAANSPPVDLLGFVLETPTREVVRVLGLSKGTVHNLRSGYWPADARKIMQAWDAYKGRSLQRATSWFVRRVQADGVHHSGKVYASPQLAGRTGELLAVARAADGTLIAQALELPADRFTLCGVKK